MFWFETLQQWYKHPTIGLYRHVLPVEYYGDNTTSSPRPYVSPEENETSRFLQERHMAVGTRLGDNSN